MADTNPKDPYAAVKYAIRGSESSHQFFRDGKLIKNPNSSAKGPYQFTNGTWAYVNEIAKNKYGKRLNQNVESDHDLAVSILLQQNEKALRNAGLPVNPGTLYLMHFKGDPNFVRQAINNPNLPASSVFSSDEINANGSILRGKTVGQAAQILINKINKNMPQNSPNRAIANRYSTPTQKKAMASLTGPKNPNFDTAQQLPKAQRDAIIQEYKSEIRRMKKMPGGQDLINQYNKQMYDLGYIGFNADGSAKGFIAEGVRNQMTANQKKADDLVKAKRMALRTLGEVMRDNLEATDDGFYFKTDVQGAKSTLSKGINKIAKILPNSLEVRKDLDDMRKSLDKLDKGQGAQRDKNQMEFFNKLQNYYSKTTGQKAEFFKEFKINTGEGPGKTMTRAGWGPDIDIEKPTFGDPIFRFKQNGKNFNVENPFIPGGNVQDIVLPDMNPSWDPVQDDAIPGVDDTWGDIGSAGTPVPTVDDLNYYKPEWDNSKANNRAILQEMERYRNQGAAADVQRSGEMQTNTTAENAKTQEQNDIEAAASRLELGDVEPPEDMSNTGRVSTGAFISGLPLGKLAMGAMGIALGKELINNDLPERDERIDNTLLSYIYEQKRIGEMGMNPTEEAAAKQEMADAYQMGIDNLTRNASGNRNLILGNIANLDNINSKRMMDLALKDVEIKQRASEAYGRAIQYVNQFNAEKSIANNERKYQQAVQKQAMGASILSGAFKSMSDAISSYSPPNSTENLYKIQQQVELFGFSPDVADDGTGETWGSKSWYQKKIKTAQDTYNRNQTLMEQFNMQSPEERNAFLLEHKNSSRGQMLEALNRMYNPTEETTTEPNASTTTTVDENGNVLSQESTTSQATVPMNVTQVQKQDGTTTVATPYSVKGTDGTSANASMTPGQPTLVLPNKTTMFDRLNQKPIQIGTYGTKDGLTIDVQTDKTQKPTVPENGIAFSNFDTNKAFAGMMGLEDTYNQASDINQYYSQFGETDEERFGNISNIIKKYS